MLIEKRGLKVKSQLEVPVVFKGNIIDNALMLDLLDEDLIIVEINAVEKLLQGHYYRYLLI
jgi:GxxExxY protein